MRWTPWVILITATGLAVHAVGCRNSSPAGAPPPDPLLISKKPQEGKIDDPPPLATPSMPTAPATAYAAERSFSATPASTVRLQHPDTQRAPSRTPSSTVSWSSEKSAPALTYASDYSWLQGTVERAGPDRWLLRYSPPAGTDYWGGVVCLDPDPRLAMLRDGTAVRVQGEMVKEDGRVQVAAWMPYPRYRVRQVVVPSN